MNKEKLCLFSEYAKAYSKKQENALDILVDVEVNGRKVSDNIFAKNKKLMQQLSAERAAMYEK